MKQYLTILLIVFMVLPSSVIVSQEKKQLKDSKHKIGFSVGLGKNNGLGFTTIKIDRDYDVYLFQFQHYYSLYQRKLWGVEILSQPQINFSKFRFLEENESSTNAIEFGLNIGLLIRVNFFNDTMSLYGLIGSGPHFITKAPQRQAKGFIFSDNFFMGLNIRMSNNTFLDFRSGKRHMSNFNLQTPNGGINTFIMNIGIIKLL